MYYYVSCGVFCLVILGMIYKNSHKTRQMYGCMVVAVISDVAFNFLFYRLFLGLKCHTTVIVELFAPPLAYL